MGQWETRNRHNLALNFLPTKTPNTPSIEPIISASVLLQMKMHPSSCQRTSLLMFWIRSHLSRTLFWKLVIHLYQFLSFCWIILISTQRWHRIFHLQKFSSPLALSPASFVNLLERAVYICFSYFTSHFLNTLKLFSKLSIKSSLAYICKTHGSCSIYILCHLFFKSSG